MLEAHQTKDALTSSRVKTIQDQSRLDYQNEYDRIRRLVDTNLAGLGKHTVERLRERQAELGKLGAEVVDKIQ